MSTNPFAVASSTAPAAPAAPTAAPVAPAAPAAPVIEPDDDEILESEEGDTGVKLTKTGKPRKPRNRTITSADKNHILTHYCSEATGDIAKQLGLTRAQVYNVVRNSRKQLEEQLENPELPNEMKHRIQVALSKLPKKESTFGGGAAGTRKQTSIDDILAGLGV